METLPERCFRNGHPFLRLNFTRRPESEMRDRAVEFARNLATRRSVRDFSPEPVPEAIVVDAIRAAATAPSGANQQPWRFALVANPELKRRIRQAAEKEERESYESRMPPDWLAALAPLQTDWQKPFLELAPYLIVVFRLDWHTDDVGRRVKHYYPTESVGIACGFLLAALHHAGLATLTHTPSPMGFLREILGRPENEKPFLLIPVGYPADDAYVPDIRRQPLDELLVRFPG